MKRLMVERIAGILGWHALGSKLARALGALLFATATIAVVQIAMGATVETDTRVMRSGTHENWYDVEKSEFVFPSAQSLLEQEKELADRHRFEDVAPDKTPSPSDFWDRVAKIYRVLSQIVSTAVFYVVLVIIILILTWFLWRTLQERGFFFFKSRQRSLNSERGLEQPASLVDLPFRIDESSPSDLLKRAEIHRQAGEYAPSIIYLFGHLLMELDAADCIRLQRGKTNRVYLRELRPDESLWSLHRSMTDVFEAAFFGRVEISRETSDRCWALLPQYRESIQAAKERRLEGAVPAVVAAKNPAPSVLSTGLVLGLAWLGGAMLPGCAGGGQDETTYGAYDYRGGRMSLGGISLFRAMCEAQRHGSIEIASFSPRSAKLDVIVWVPHDVRVPNQDEINWLNDWLANGDSRILVFVGRDYSPFTRYWEEAAAKADPKERRTFLIEAAKRRSAFEIQRAVVGEEKCPWFTIEDFTTLPQKPSGFRGKWADALENDDYHIEVRSTLIPNRRPWIHTLEEEDEDGVKRKVVSDYRSAEIERLLQTDTNRPLVTRITYDHWNEGGIMVLANGSLILNEALTESGNRRLMQRVIDAFPLGGRIGFLSQSGETLIRNANEGNELQGFALLRVWPLSLISIHGLFVGFIALLSLLPIFGRPQRLPTPSTTDFGKHVEALGDLLQRSGDRQYALQRIAEYFGEVRRDTASVWASLPPPRSEIHPPTLPVASNEAEKAGMTSTPFKT